MTCRGLHTIALLLLPLNGVLAEGAGDRPPSSTIGPGSGVERIISASPQPASGDSIEFDGHRITLGMPRDQVLKLVAESYEVVPQGDERWWVNDRKAGGTIGTLTFRQGVLTLVTRDWEVVESGAGPAINILNTAFRAIGQMVPGAARSCTVSPDRLATQTGFSVSCGPMLVQIFMTTDPGEGTRAWVHTALGGEIWVRPERP